MSSQDTYEEKCANCGDDLVAQVNWNINDVEADIRYCTKGECQQAKPLVMNAADTGARRRRQMDRDRGLAQTLRPRSRFIKIPPDPAKVTEFAAMLNDPRMKNARGAPRYSKIFKEYGINESKKGFTAAEMAVPQYPNEVDVNGCPSVEAVNAVRNYLKRLTKRYKGNLEIYSTKTVRDTEPHRRESRWHVLKEHDDLNKQVDAMMKISKSIELAAKQREVNFSNKTYDERMKKVDLLDQFFEENGQ